MPIRCLKAKFIGLVIAKIGHYRPILASKPTYDPLRYVGGFLEFRNLDFRGLKGQFDGKKAQL